MFEMKNESDRPAAKRNEDFLKELDRTATRGVRYAVLVSLLEPGRLYNSGIVDVSHPLPKMYVVRPAVLLCR